VFASVDIMADVLVKEVESMRRSIAMPPARPERPQPGVGNRASARESVPDEVPVHGVP